MGKSRTRKQRSETSQMRKQRLETRKNALHTKGSNSSNSSNRTSRSSKSSIKSINDTWRNAESPGEYKKDEFYTIEQLRYIDSIRDTNNKILYPGNKFEIKLNTDIRNNPLQFTRQYPVTGFLNSFTIDPPLISIRHKDKYTDDYTTDTYSSKYHLFRVIKVKDHRKTKT